MGKNKKIISKYKNIFEGSQLEANFTFLSMVFNENFEKEKNLFFGGNYKNFLSKNIFFGSHDWTRDLKR